MKAAIGHCAIDRSRSVERRWCGHVIMPHTTTPNGRSWGAHLLGDRMRPEVESSHYPIPDAMEQKFREGREHAASID